MKPTHVILALAFLATSYSLNAQTNYLETVKVTDSIYVFKPKINWYLGNGIAIIGTTGVFFVDTYTSPNYALEAINRLKKITNLPVRYVLNTHWHYDHMYGNYEFKLAFPECEFIMHDSTYYFLKTQVKPLIDQDLELTKQGLAQFEKERKERKASNGLAITDSMVPYWDQLIEETKEVLADYRPVKLVNGDITFNDKLTLRWGNHTLKMMHLKQYAHSEGDVIVWIPEKRLVITGDIVVAPTPYETQPNAAGMVDALQYIINMNPAIVIPGHGPVQYDLSYVKLEKEAFEAYLREAEKAVQNNIPIQEASAYIKLDDLDYKFTKGDDLAKWAYRSYFRGHIISQVYRKHNAIPKKN
ncbi:MAG TPA: MBL fold metallo-hydrolase [Cyclobacteriaceae bacterium]|nr:MBL fold metallo-hydrolase [Cyclobacteriaceae bacterium]HMV08871.1 MBL fold metallo-hydrolase [Cyclobacteriaceae bacterium]HMV89296.1 MBL fold metallo-hydrolase [Cyclobacteriaceae bacterium]HMX00374.1 MBL fold metallo-hydrolase [Cyclobacteriaceae bacterium]HMX49627.1 MBL fold metallo-hydrolase [Cyclobacteriaceae bacterium]